MKRKEKEIRKLTHRKNVEGNNYLLFYEYLLNNIYIIYVYYID